MRTYLFHLALLILALSSQAAGAQTRESADNLTDLLQQVIDGANADNTVNEERVAQFQKNLDRQNQLRDQADAALQAQERTADELTQTVKDNEQAIAQLQQQLDDNLGNFGELFGVTRQVAGETAAQIKTSLISAEFPGRETTLQDIATSKVLPTLAQLRQLWVVLLQEQTEQGRVARFNARVNDGEGEPRQTSVVRVGPFTAFDDNQFLLYSSESRSLTPLAGKPASPHDRAAKRLASAAPGSVVKATVDPSQGTILSLLVQSPDHIERFKQGGLPGYIVSILAVIGIVIGLQRIGSLWIISKRVARQIKTKAANSNNPLGRILAIYEKDPNSDVETLELKLNDGVMKEVPRLDRGLNTLKVLAAVAPLLGLLGTVVGMIVTFQTMTLWGTGDPKMMAGGISQALVTTVQGLVAAIPLLLLHSIANGRARIIQQVLEEQSAGLIARRAEAKVLKA